MYRSRFHSHPKTIDGWNEMMQIVEEVSKVCAARGWVSPTIWVPTVGDVSELVLEFDYPDLASFQRENDEALHDKELVDLLRRSDAIEKNRTGYSELLESASSLG